MEHIFCHDTTRCLNQVLFLSYYLFKIIDHWELLMEFLLEGNYPQFFTNAATKISLPKFKFSDSPEWQFYIDYPITSLYKIIHFWGQLQKVRKITTGLVLSQPTNLYFLLSHQWMLKKCSVFKWIIITVQLKKKPQILNISKITNNY